ncbi:MAG: Na/Pi cotransporter family protein [Defluviitaleaceae bacterium]|nr:Na/Pi cotransporter family protein [Defluviitaleaceae bacterium]
MVNIFAIIFGLLGGLALFLYGLHTMGTGLQEMAGKKANRVLEILTSVPIVGMLVGTVVTIVVQSSTLVTVMVVSLVNSTMLNLKQAASVIMGANIGTTLTAQLVAFRITDIWVYCAAAGFLVYFFAKRKSIKTTGLVFFAFSMLLLGLSLMTDAMRPLREEPTFLNLISNFSDNRILAMLVGLIFTAVVQSSTAVTGVIVAMTMEDLIPLSAALPLIIGTNVGTCFTAVLASIGGSTAAKRAAAVHVVFNATGALIFLIFLPQFEAAVLFISPDYDVPRQAANAHTLFSVVSTAMFLPLIGLLVKFVTFIIPEKKTDGEDEKVTSFLDRNMVNNPTMAITMAQKELVSMAEIAGKNVQLALDGFVGKKKKKLKLLKKQEKLVDKMEKEIVSYLAAVSQAGMGRHMSIRHAGLLHAANDIERVSDHATNIAKLAQQVIEEKIDFPRDAIKEIEDIFKPVSEIFKTAVQSVSENDTKLIPRIKELESLIDKKEKEMRTAHIKRIARGEISAEGGIIYLDVLSNFERIGDHSMNISHLPQGKL